MPVPKQLDRIRRQPLSSVVFDQLLDRILTGTFQPGHVMPPERQLCQELGVSRTAVREALARLQQLRLIQIRQGGETRILDYESSAGLDLLPHVLRRPSSHHPAHLIRSGFEMRAAIAPDMARLCAQRSTPDVLRELRLVVEEMERANNDIAKLQPLSLRFWSAIALGSQNLAYQLAFNTLRETVRDLPGLAEAQAIELRDLKGYRAIAEAVRRTDEAAAARAARAHIELGLDSLLRLSKRRPS